MLVGPVALAQESEGGFLEGLGQSFESTVEPFKEQPEPDPSARQPSARAAQDENPPINIGNPLSPGFSGQTTERTPGNTVEQQIQTRLGYLLGVMLRGIAALSLLPIVVGGFQMIISQGNEDKVARGKNTVYFGVVGLVLALVAIALFQTLLSYLVTAR